jgi:hypothetical protein
MRRFGQTNLPVLRFGTPARLSRSALALSAAGATLMTAVSPASASALGYGKVGSFCYEVKGIQLCAPGATIGHLIQVQGRTITREEASVQDILGGDTAGGKWCNWRIDWSYADTDNRTYQVSKGPTENSCTFITSVGRIDKAKRTLKHYGKACAVFYASGVKRGSQCHNIIE